MTTFLSDKFMACFLIHFGITVAYCGFLLANKVKKYEKLWAFIPEIWFLIQLLAGVVELYWVIKLKIRKRKLWNSRKFK